MIPRHTVNVTKLTGDGLLAGRMSGAALWPRILDATAGVVEDSLLIVDLKGIELMTASFFNAGLFPLWQEALRRRAWYPIVMGATPAVVDDIELVFRDQKVAGWGATDSSFIETMVIGPLEGWYQDVVARARQGAVSAALLHEADRSIGPTAWSNRLALLHSLRLLRPKKVGRQLYFNLPWREA